MDEAAIGLIGGAVGTLARIVYAALGLSGRYAILASVGVTTVAVWLYGLQAHAVWRDVGFSYFVGWCDVLAVAAGSFHLIEEMPKAANDPGGLIQQLTGRGDGK